jgi:aspartate ammonia-lyase
VEDVNLHQSTNDVYPTALKIACIEAFRLLNQEIAAVQGAFQKKEKEFAAVVKIGRTEMQEAVPITLGAEFGAFAEAFSRDRWRTFKCEERLRVVNIGGTAVGTGLTAPRSYIFLVIEKLREGTGMGLSRGENSLDATANTDCFVEVSGILKSHAVNLIKVSNDLRMMSLLGEIALPARQAGSSVMAGKVNPVILEAAIQTGMKVIANDALITDCCAKATFQINEFMPLLSQSILESLELLLALSPIFAEHISGISADPDACRASFDKSITLITAFLPHIGYEKATALAQEYRSRSGRALSVRAFLVEKLGAELVDRVLDPHNLTSLGFRDHGKNA